MTTAKETCPKCGSEFNAMGLPKCGSILGIRPIHTTLCESRCRITELERENERLREVLTECSDSVVLFLGHNSHWDHTMQGGLGCCKCIEQKTLVEHIQSRASTLLAKGGKTE